MKRIVLSMVVILFFAHAIYAGDPLPLKDWQDESLVKALSLKESNTKYVPHDQLSQEILKRGMKMHDLLWQGDDQSAEIRKTLRAKLRTQRDAALKAKYDLVVHEWGTFNYLQNKRGARIGIFTDDASDLPKSVYVWANMPIRAPEMILKPIIYLYAKKKMEISLKVNMPKGIPTQWYPVAKFWPEKYDQKQPPIKNGGLIWHPVDVDPDPDPKLQLANIDENHPWWHIARDVDAAMLTSKGEREKFLFYRGLLDDASVVKVEMLAEEQGASVPDVMRYKVSNATQWPIDHLLMVQVKDGQAVFQYLRQLKPEAKHTFDLTMFKKAKPVKQQFQKRLDHFQECLEEQGLFPKEAAGLCRVWGQEFLKTEGVRLFYIMPKPKVDELYPLEITRQAKEGDENVKHSRVNVNLSSARVIINRVVCVTPNMEEDAKRLVKQLTSNDYKVREAAFKQLKELGVFYEAYLREILKHTNDIEVINSLEAILAELDKQKKKK